MSRPLCLMLALSLSLVGCDDDPRRGDCPPGTPCVTDMGTPDGGGGGSCAPADYTAQAEAICATNHPEPDPRTFGATCVDDGQCDSGLCADRFTGGQYCTIACPRGDECPVGYRCDESGRIDAVDTLCFREVCLYGGTDRADCIGNLLDDVEAACTGSSTSCAGELDAWVGCLATAGRQCLPGDACVVERDALERCCPTCAPDRW
jgi:hypothetical protein